MVTSERKMELIDKDKLDSFKYRSASERMDLPVDYMVGWNDAIYHIEANAPTVDAEPVRHGHWVDTTDYIGFPVWQCSKCNGDGRGDYFRCPWCGAKMDERTEE